MGIRTSIPYFTRTIVCLFVLAVTVVVSQIYGTLHWIKHPYSIDLPTGLNFVAFTLFPMMLLITLIVIVIDIFRFIHLRHMPHA